jgi:hypothetical protein
VWSNPNSLRKMCAVVSKLQENKIPKTWQILQKLNTDYGEYVTWGDDNMCSAIYDNDTVSCLAAQYYYLSNAHAHDHGNNKYILQIFEKISSLTITQRKSFYFN